jgi:hypothetical protein
LLDSLYCQTYDSILDYSGAVWHKIALTEPVVDVTLNDIKNYGGCALTGTNGNIYCWNTTKIDGVPTKVITLPGAKKVISADGTVNFLVVDESGQLKMSRYDLVSGTTKISPVNGSYPGVMGMRFSISFLSPIHQLAWIDSTKTLFSFARFSTDLKGLVYVKDQYTGQSPEGTIQQFASSNPHSAVGCILTSFENLHCYRFANSSTMLWDKVNIGSEKISSITMVGFTAIALTTTGKLFVIDEIGDVAYANSLSLVEAGVRY